MAATRSRSHVEIGTKDRSLIGATPKEPCTNLDCMGEHVLVVVSAMDAEGNIQ